MAQNGEQMSAPAGWYPSQHPGRLRWWDGAQWTEHECDAPAQAVHTSQDVHMSQDVHTPQTTPAVPANIGASPGWYPVPGVGEVRWWDGQHWAAYSIGKRGPRGNWYATEPPGVAYVFSTIFLALGLLQLGLATVASGSLFTSIAPLLLGAFWMSAAVALSIVRGRPDPAADTVVTAPVVQPLPGHVEGDGAAWIALTPKLSRWWSGARWGEYVAEANRIRPTHGGAKTFRVLKIMAWLVVAVGIIAALVGVALLVLLPPDLLSRVIGVIVLCSGLLLAVVGGILFPIIQLRRHALLLPAHPPTPALSAGA